MIYSPIRDVFSKNFPKTLWMGGCIKLIIIQNQDRSRSCENTRYMVR